MATLDDIQNYFKQRNQDNSGGLLGSLVGAYGAYNQGNAYSQNLGQNSEALQQQIRSLQDMYNPNGVVAQQMAQQMAAKDAAAGRNSQYASRSAQLQALLAQHTAQNAQTIGGLTQQQNQNNLQQQQVQAQQLASLFNVAQKSGLTDWANKGLSGLFSKYAGGGADQDFSGILNLGGSAGGAGDYGMGSPIDFGSMGPQTQQQMGQGFQDYMQGQGQSPEAIPTASNGGNFDPNNWYSQ